MVSKFQVLIDSDAFVGLNMPDDALHVRVSQVFDRLINEGQRLVATSLVIAETATVLSFKGNHQAACSFLEEMERVKFPVIHITRELQQAALTLFQEQVRRGTSVTDCANVAVMQNLAIPQIFSFDKVYSKDFGIPLITTA
jgi:predicted nucleic acid-binding protein